MPFVTSQRNLWTLRRYCFLLIGGGGFLFPFINLFYTQLVNLLDQKAKVE